MLQEQNRDIDLEVMKPLPHEVFETSELDSFLARLELLMSEPEPKIESGKGVLLLLERRNTDRKVTSKQCVDVLERLAYYEFHMLGNIDIYREQHLVDSWFTEGSPHIIGLPGHYIKGGKLIFADKKYTKFFIRGLYK